MHHRRRRSNDSPIEERKLTIRMKPKAPDCRLCRKDHPLRKCVKFSKMSVSARLDVVKRHRYCRNCLAHSHLIHSCRSRERCNHCNSQHHTLLHPPEITRVNEPLSRAGTTTVVPTVIIKMRLNDEWGQVRGLLNPCAATSSIAAFLVERYHLPFERFNEDKWCHFSFRTRFDDEGGTFTVKARITEDLPERPPPKRLDRSVTDAYRNLRLADPDFFISNTINFILGADVYPRIIRSGLQTSSIGSPLAQDTVLGWVIVGKFAV